MLQHRRRYWLAQAHSRKPPFYAVLRADACRAFTIRQSAESDPRLIRPQIPAYRMFRNSSGRSNSSVGNASPGCHYHTSPLIRITYKILQYQTVRLAMSISASDIVPFSQARANLSDLADQVKAGAEKIITKNGESYVALIDSDRLDYYHQLERERIHLLLISEANKGLVDIAAGRTSDARTALQAIKRRRSGKAGA
jgi:antitoxin (DNA-binding transcriptional repressor) of toxin-antitoxin stability system